MCSVLWVAAPPAERKTAVEDSSGEVEYERRPPVQTSRKLLPTGSHHANCSAVPRPDCQFSQHRVAEHAGNPISPRVSRDWLQAGSRRHGDGGAGRTGSAQGWSVFVAWTGIKLACLGPAATCSRTAVNGGESQ